MFRVGVEGSYGKGRLEKAQNKKNILVKAKHVR